MIKQLKLKRKTRQTRSRLIWTYQYSSLQSPAVVRLQYLAQYVQSTCRLALLKSISIFLSILQFDFLQITRVWLLQSFCRNLGSKIRKWINLTKVNNLANSYFSERCLLHMLLRKQFLIRFSDSRSQVSLITIRYSYLLLPLTVLWRRCLNADIDFFWKYPTKFLFFFVSSTEKNQILMEKTAWFS